jgi:hypothetical protein
MTRFENVGVFILQHFHINTPTFSNLVILHTYPLMKIEQTYKIQTPGNYPEESIQHSEQGECLKSGMLELVLRW